MLNYLTEVMLDPLIVCGDFHSILRPYERIRGDIVLVSDLYDFVN